jgi:cell division protein FtsB
MNKNCVFLLFIVLNFFIGSISAEASDSNAEQKETFLPGMETKVIGSQGQRLYLPRGTKLRKIGAQLIIEDNAEYVADRLWILKNRIKQLETENEELKKQIQDLKNKAH